MKYAAALLLLVATCGPQRGCAAPPPQGTIVSPPSPAPAAPTVHEEPAPGLEPAPVLIVPAKPATHNVVKRRSSIRAASAVWPLASSAEISRAWWIDKNLDSALLGRLVGSCRIDPTGRTHLTSWTGPSGTEDRIIPYMKCFPCSYLKEERDQGWPDCCPWGQPWDPKKPAGPKIACCSENAEQLAETGYPLCGAAKADLYYRQCPAGVDRTRNACIQP